ncbi:MAG: cytochrome c [Thermoanaerobaculia bacterium]
MIGKIRTSRPTDVVLRIGLLAILALLIVPAFGSAQQTEPDKPFLVSKGRVTYRVYCINCHGAKAKGDGNLAELLTVKVSDLTQIKKENDGKFLADDVAKTIDGREQVRGHGMKEMPVWGDVFQTSVADPSAADGSGEERARTKIRELVLYLETIQE